MSVRAPAGMARIEVNGRTVWRSDHVFPAPKAEFAAERRQAILDVTALPLLVPIGQQNRFWAKVQLACRLFAHGQQSDWRRAPTAEEIRTAQTAAQQLAAALRPFLEHAPAPEDPPEPAPEDPPAPAPMLPELMAFGACHTLLRRLDAIPPAAGGRPEHPSSAMFVGDIGGIYKAAFGRDPSQSLDGPFSRFVLACLDATEGLPQRIRGYWLQKQVRTRKEVFDQPNMAGRELWKLAPQHRWDETG